MSFIEELEAEIHQAADKLGVDILISLLDKWEEDFERAMRQGIVDHDRMLGHYIRLKITLHHLDRHYHRSCDWTGCDPRGVEIGNKIHELKQKVQNARRDYYVAKRRIEEEHRDGCDCRGCRCLGYFCPGDPPEVGEPAPGA